MRGRSAPLTLGAACLVAAVLVGLLAEDVRNWSGAVRKGDVRMRIVPARGDPWRLPNRFPFRTAEHLIGARDDVAFRRALRAFVLTRPRYRGRFGFGFIAPRDGARNRFRAIQRGSGDPANRSAAANFLGLMAYESAGFIDSGYIRTSTRLFQDAVRLDPGNDQAKFNLELMLDRAEQVYGQGALGRPRRQEATGAGFTPPGRGY